MMQKNVLSGSPFNRPGSKSGKKVLQGIYKEPGITKQHPFVLKCNRSSEIWFFISLFNHLREMYLSCIQDNGFCLAQVRNPWPRGLFEQDIYYFTPVIIQHNVVILMILPDRVKPTRHCRLAGRI